jgi:predicted ATP-binding protein involved in virulence
LLLVSDIARRLSIANPMLSVEEILEKGEGIILIDEIEQHLHPKWQRNILSALEKTFPNLQFIITTHSPQVLSGTIKENVFILDNFKISKRKPYVEGRDSNSILEDAFNFSKYSPEIKSKIDDFYELLEKDIKQAEKILNSIKEKFGESDSEVKRATMYLEDEKEDLE